MEVARRAGLESRNRRGEHFVLVNCHWISSALRIPKQCRRNSRIAAAVIAALAVAVPIQAQSPPSNPGTAAGSAAAEVVKLPPYVLDAVEPPWALDTRTANTTIILPSAAPTISMVGALRGYPGVAVDQPGGPGGRSSLYLRGGEDNYTVVLLDGVPVNNSTDSRGGGFDFGTLDANEFAAAEIIRGPVSARYGAEALSGVVELTSDVLGPPGPSEMGAEAGPDGQATGYVLARGVQKDLMAAASVHWSEDGSRSAGNFARHESAATGVVWERPNYVMRASVRYGRSESAAFPDDSGGLRFAVLRALESRSDSRTTASVELTSPDGRKSGLKWQVRAWGAWLHADDNSPGVAPGIRDPAGLPVSLEATSLDRFGFSADGAVAAGRHGTLTFGADGDAEQGRSTSVLIYGPYPFPGSFASTRDRVGTFGEYSWQPAAGWLVTASGRLDKARDYSPHFTPRVGVKIPLGAGTVLRVNAGTGFKRPSFYAVSNPLVGNPALKPEKAQTLDAAIERPVAGGRATVEIAGFSSRYRDGIDFDPGPPPRLVNRSEIRSDGVEVSLHANPAASLELMVSGTYDDVRSEPGNGRLRGRPETEGSLRAIWTPRPGLMIGSSLVAVGQVFDSSVPTGDIGLPAWWRMDVSARYRIRPGLSVIAAVDNLFDAQYEEAIGVPSPGTRWRAGFQARF